MWPGQEGSSVYGKLLGAKLPFSRSPQLFPPAPCLWASARRGKQGSMVLPVSPIQTEGHRKQEEPDCLSEHAVKLACPPRVALAPSWRPKSCSLRRICFLGKAGLATQACLFSPSFIQTAHKCPAGKGDQVALSVFFQCPPGKKKIKQNQGGQGLNFRFFFPPLSPQGARGITWPGVTDLAKWLQLRVCCRAAPSRRER